MTELTLIQALEEVKKSDYKGKMLKVKWADGSFCSICGGMDKHWNFDHTVDFAFCIETQETLSKIESALGDIAEAKAVLDSDGKVVFWNINFTITL